MTHFLNLKIYYFPSDFDPASGVSHEGRDWLSRSADKHTIRKKMTSLFSHQSLKKKLATAKVQVKEFYV